MTETAMPGVSQILLLTDDDTNIHAQTTFCKANDDTRQETNGKWTLETAKSPASYIL